MAKLRKYQGGGKKKGAKQKALTYQLGYPRTQGTMPTYDLPTYQAAIARDSTAIANASPFLGGELGYSNERNMGTEDRLQINREYREKLSGIVPTPNSPSVTNYQAGGPMLGQNPNVAQDQSPELMMELPQSDIQPTEQMQEKSVAAMMRKGGTRKRKYQPGGMYADNTVTSAGQGVANSTAMTTFEESDPGIQAARISDMENKVSAAQNEAANTAQEMEQREEADKVAVEQKAAEVGQVEEKVKGYATQALEAKDTVKEGQGVVKDYLTKRAGKRASKQAAKKMAADAAKRKALGLAAKDFSTEGIKKSGEEVSKILADTAVDQGKEIVLDKAKGQGFQSFMNLGTDQASKFAIKEGGEEIAKQGAKEIGKEVIKEGAETLGTEAVKEIGKEGAKTGIKKLAESSVNPNPYATAANLVGKGISMASDDQDATTWNAGEVTGDVLGSAGEYAGYGAMLGSVVPGVGNVVGAVGGAIVGAGKAAVQGLVRRKKARKEKAKLDEQRVRDTKKSNKEVMENVAQARGMARAGEIKQKTYSGYDLGRNVTYGMGGYKNFKNKKGGYRTIPKYI